MEFEFLFVLLLLLTNSLYTETKLTKEQPLVIKEKSVSIAKPDKEKSVSIAKPDKEKSVSIAKPDKEKSVSIAKPDKEKSVSIAKPDKEKSVSIAKPDKEKSISIAKPDKEKSKNMDVNNPRPSAVDVEILVEKCCIDEGKKDDDCEIMKVYGGYIGQIKSKETKTTTFIYPTHYPHDMAGNCILFLKADNFTQIMSPY
ncbi:unnamed protein product [Mytilus coruscus]|uniref:Uncharacterized protein n=1 Tax=Mytilus coruscus TaxID=42192 RepID=A0A6J8C1A4_MYTCO|nr:unnamed protein product [Mytilus coruscus]